jgi:hypothetical protein
MLRAGDLMPSRDPPLPTGFPPVTSGETDAAGASRAVSTIVAPTDAVAIVRRHRARIAAAPAVSPEMRRAALDILDAVLDDLRAPRETGSRS